MASMLKEALKVAAVAVMGFLLEVLTKRPDKPPPPPPNS